MKTLLTRIICIGLLALLGSAALALPALAQDADDDFENPDPCRGDPQNPIVFEMYPASVQPGASFLISGMPHDPRTVGPGSDVAFNWVEDATFQNYTARVGTNGKFSGIITVPKDFSPGKHILQYAEASPYTSCVEFTVISAEQAAAQPPEFPGARLVFTLLGLLVSLLSVL